MIRALNFSKTIELANEYESKTSSEPVTEDNFFETFYGPNPELEEIFGLIPAKPWSAKDERQAWTDLATFSGAYERFAGNEENPSIAEDPEAAIAGFESNLSRVSADSRDYGAMLPLFNSANHFALDMALYLTSYRRVEAVNQVRRASTDGAPPACGMYPFPGL